MHPCSSSSLSLQRITSLFQRSVSRRFASAGSSIQVDPSRLVHGVRMEDLEQNQELEEYFRANFPDAFKDPKVLRQEEADRQQAIAEQEALQIPKRYPGNVRPLQCFTRDPIHEEGSRACQNLRRENMIPGLLRGSDPNLGIYSHQSDSEIFIKTEWKVLQKELDRYHRQFESRVYDLTVYPDNDNADAEPTTHRVIPQNVQRHPVDSSVYCANFCRYHAGRPIPLPVVLVNQEESPALKREGFMIPIQRTIECFVEDGADIPDALELECGGLQMKDVLRKDRINLPEGVRFSDRVHARGNDFIIGVIFGKRGGGDADDEDDGGETPGEDADDAA